MREFKFRAWDKNSKEMFISKHLREFFDIFEYGTDIGDVVIMQYAGLNDKNDKEIYEGDILIHKSGKVTKVIFELGEFCTYDSINNTTHLYMLNKDVEVLGNIYKNSETLKEV